MGKTNLGRVAFVPRGTYSNETSYKRLDVVEHEGSSYLFLKDSTGITPTGDGEVTMLLANKGKDFIYDDFTPEQLAALKGAKGDKGDPGKGLTIFGYYGTLDLLKASVTTPEPGDAYGIGTAAPYDIYVFDGVTNDWVNNGKLSSGGEGGGNVVLIPFAITGLTDKSTSEEVLAAWGGRDNLISICKQMHDSKAICKLYGGDENSSVAYIISVNSTNYINDDNAMMELYVGAGSSSLMLQVLLTNGVASFNVKPQNPVTSTKLPDAIFDLTSQSTSEQILNVFGGIDKIADIYNKIGGSGENQYDILIAENRNKGNGYSVLHNFGGSWLSDSQNNGFDRQIYFAYTSIEPAIEVIRWVIKFNNTSAVCEVTKQEVGYANVVSIPSDVMSLSNESTSEQILNVFGGKPAFDAIIEKVRVGKVVGIISDADVSTMLCQIGLRGYTDSDNYGISFNSIGSGAVFIVNIEVLNGVFSFDSNIHLLLLDSSLVSDPSVGGTDKPASAEAVKIVNDKVVNTQKTIIDRDCKSVILLYEKKDIAEGLDYDNYHVIDGIFYGNFDLGDTYSPHQINLRVIIRDVNDSISGYSYLKAAGKGFYNLCEAPRLVECTHEGKTWIALDISTGASDYSDNYQMSAINYFTGYTDIKTPFKVVYYMSGHFPGGPHEVINREINDSIKILFDDFEGFVGKPKATAYYTNSDIEHTYKVDRDNVLIWRADAYYDAPIINFVVKAGVTYFEAVINSGCSLHSELTNVPIEIRINGKRIGMSGSDGITERKLFRFFYHRDYPESQFPFWDFIKS